MANENNPVVGTAAMVTGNSGYTIALEISRSFTGKAAYDDFLHMFVDECP